jgi:hypothetical protein
MHSEYFIAGDQMSNKAMSKKGALPKSMEDAVK